MKAGKGAVSRQAGGEFRLAESIPYRIYRITEALANNMRQGLRQRALTISQWRILSTLRSEGPLTVGQLVAFTAMKQAVVSRVLGEMEDQGQIARGHLQDDQRVVSVSLTPAGRKLFESLLPVDEKHRAKVLAGFDAQATRELRTLLGRLEKNLGIDTL